VSTKERLHELIDKMEDGEAAALLTRLDPEFLPFTEEDLASIQRGRTQAGAGNSRTTDEVIERLRSRT